MFALAPAAQATGQSAEAAADAIRATISAQIEAFRRDDAAAAFGFAAPGIQAKFESPNRFMAMVRAGYQPVYRPREVRFRALDLSGPQPVQQVWVVGPDGVAYVAHYPMEMQADGSWRIAGCTLVPLDDEPA